MAETMSASSPRAGRCYVRLRKAWRDHVFRSSDSVVLECRREWVRAGTPDTPGLSFCTVTRADALPPLDGWLAPRAAAFAAMCRAGKIGVFALRDGVAVGCVWLALSDHRDRRSREHYRVRPGEAYHYCWLVAPSERPRGGALALARYVLRVLGDWGIERQFGVIDRDNRASYRVQRHFGYRECGTLVRHFHLFHVRWTRVSHYQGTLGLHAGVDGGRKR